MNKKETLEIRKQFTNENCAITRICGCYVDAEKQIRTELKEAFLSLPEEEIFKYYEIFKKTLSGTVGKNLLNMEFPIAQEMPDGTQAWLLKLRDSKLQDEILLEEFYEKWTQWKLEKYAKYVHSELRKFGEKYIRPGELFEYGERYEMAPPPKSQATILMMKSESVRVRNTGIERNGFYYNDQDLMAHIGEKVDIKYDPDDVSVIYVYDKKGRPICSAQSYDLLQFGKVSDETLKEHRRQQNAQIRDDRKIAEEASIPFEQLNDRQQNADKVIGAVSLMMEGSKKNSKVTQMPKDRTWRQTGVQLRQEMQERQNCEYMNSQAQKALERLRQTREA